MSSCNKVTHQILLTSFSSMLRLHKEQMIHADTIKRSNPIVTKIDSILSKKDVRKLTYAKVEALVEIEVAFYGTV